MRRGAWSNRYGFYLATVGSAFSLGNLWRFPYVVDSNGGGAFVVTYILMCLVIGLPIVVAELMLGRLTRLSITNAIQKISEESSVGWMKGSSLVKWVGHGSNFMSVFLLAFYTVICGWVLFFLVQYVVHLFLSTPLEDELFDVLMKNGWLQVGLMSVHLLIATIFVGKGLKLGIERLTSLVVPVFVLLMIYLVFKSLSLPGTSDAMRFLFYPNFSYFTRETLLKVLGHVFFTLSVGMGAMVVFGSYLRAEAYVPRTGFQVVVLDIVISIFAGLLIFPIVFSANINGDYGPSLIFNTLSVFFNKMGFGNFFGLLFFLCLYLAALGASMMLLETTVSHLIDRRKIKRTHSSWIMAAIVFVVALPPVLSSTLLSGLSWKGLSVLRLYDKILIDYLLPCICLGISLLVGYGIDMKKIGNLFINEDELDSEKLFRNWQFLVRWLVPGMILLGFVLSFL